MAVETSGGGLGGQCVGLLATLLGMSRFGLTIGWSKCNYWPR